MEDDFLFSGALDYTSRIGEGLGLQEVKDRFQLPQQGWVGERGAAVDREQQE